MNKLKTVMKFALVIPVLLLFAGLHYALPQVDVVRAVGVEIKRVDIDDNVSGQQRTRDVSYVQMETPRGQPRVYRNEDNFLYGKFDSSNLQAQVQSLSSNKQLVAIRHYGWRITLFSAYPNAIKVWPVEEGYRHIPIFNTLFLLGFGLLGVLGLMRYRRASQARVAARSSRDAERAAADADAARDAEIATQRARDADRTSRADIDDFLNSGGDGKD